MQNVEDIALSFHDLSIATSYPPATILSNVSGFVTKGGITAVLGASASGKSVLMKALAGRLQNLEIFGNVSLNCSRLLTHSLSHSLTLTYSLTHSYLLILTLTYSLALMYPIYRIASTTYLKTTS